MTRDELILNNLPLVTHIARRYVTRGGMDLDDLIQHGKVGIIIAADRFDPARGIKFCTYATYWVKERILYALRYETRLVHVPTCAFKNKFRKFALAAESVQPFTGMECDARPERPYEEPLPDIPWQRLDGRRREIVRRYFGFDGPRETMQEIARRLGISKQRVNQLMRRAIYSLRKGILQHVQIHYSSGS